MMEYLSHILHNLSFHFLWKKLTFTSSKSILCFTLIKLGAWQNHILKSREGPLSVTLLILSSKTQFNCFFKSRERESIEMFFVCVCVFFPLKGWNRSVPLLGKSNIVKLPHIRTQTLYSLKRILDNGLSLGIHSILFMSPHGTLSQFQLHARKV